MRMIESGQGFARYALGDVMIVALHDGHVDMPPSRLRQRGDRPFGAELPAEVQLVEGQLRLSVNAFLVIHGGRQLLIDTGASNAWDPTMGNLPQALAAAGLDPRDIQSVALTHTHIDHVRGLLAPDGSEAFPALEQIFVPEAEAAIFDEGKPLARFRLRHRRIGDGAVLSDRVTAVLAAGHSPGHTAFEVSSHGETLLIWGDIVHVPSIQFSRPELSWELDGDQNRARAARMAMLERAARLGVFVAGAHLDFPGIGKVARMRDSFCFSPL